MKFQKYRTIHLLKLSWYQLHATMAVWNEIAVRFIRRSSGACFQAIPGWIRLARSHARSHVLIRLPVWARGYKNCNVPRPRSLHFFMDTPRCAAGETHYFGILPNKGRSLPRPIKIQRACEHGLEWVCSSRETRVIDINQGNRGNDGNKRIKLYVRNLWLRSVASFYIRPICRLGKDCAFIWWRVTAVYTVCFHESNRNKLKRTFNFFRLLVI